MVAAPESGRIWGGIGTYLAQLTHGMDPKHELIVLSGSGASSPDSRVRTIPITEGGTVVTTYLSVALALRRRLPELVREYRPDLLVVHHAQMPDLLAPRVACPVVVTAHTTILGQASGTVEALRFRGPLDGSERFVLAGLPATLSAEVYYWKRVRHALFVSNAVRSEVVGTYGPKLTTSTRILNGYVVEEAPAARADASEEPGFILCIGRLLSWKGIAVLLQAMRHMKRPDRLILTGSGRVDAWRAYARSIGLPPEKAQFVGAIPRADLLARIRDAKLVVLPSFRESCPFSLIEAMSFGKPSVVSSLPGTRDMVQDGVSARLVPPGDPVGLAAAIDEVLGDEDLARRLGQKAAQVAREKFSLDRMCGDTFRYYQQVLAAS